MHISQVCSVKDKPMLTKYRNEQFSLTPVKAQLILAQYGTHISLEDAEIMLELLRKLSKLSVRETLKHFTVSQSPAMGRLLNLNSLPMQVADLHVRVSTDEQTKGYSPRSQEAVLRQYCQLRNITVRHVFVED